MSIPVNCEGISRRNSLQLGLGAFLGGGLAHALRLRGDTVREKTIAPQATSCILVWMDGGPTHYETFDPKPDAPEEIRGILDPIDTRVSGITFSKHMQRLAEISDKLAVVRSIRHNQGNHGANNQLLFSECKVENISE